MDKKEMWRKINSAPENIQDVILSFETSDAVRTIATNHNLKPEQAIQLSKEVSLRLLNATKKESLSKSLEKYLSIPSYQAEKISDEIEQKIVLQIKPIEPDTKPKISTDLPSDKIQTKPSAVEIKRIVPENLPTESSGQKIPDFIKVTNFKTEPKQTLNVLERQVSEKPSYVAPQSGAPVTKTVSQDEILRSREQKRPAFVPTRPYAGYKDEKIGGVNIEKNKEDEIDENIDREALLRDIENPVQSPASGGNTIQRNPYKGNDPYREPTE